MTNRERLEYRFRWDGAEHQRVYRAVQREVRRGSKLKCAIQLPKRAVGDLDELRGWLSQKEQADASRELRTMEPVRR